MHVCWCVWRWMCVRLCVCGGGGGGGGAVVSCRAAGCFPVPCWPQAEPSIHRGSTGMSLA